jgi:Baseplate J-like protein
MATGVTGNPSSLPTQSFTTIVQKVVAGIQGRASRLINFAIGSTLRAIAEAFGGIFLWFQALVLQLLTAIRLSTASGLDVDTFTADFMPVLPGSQTAALPGGSPRLGAQASSGQVTFSRFTAGPSSCFVPAAASVSASGAITPAGPNTPATVQSADGSQNFVVIADPTYATYSAALGGYTMPAEVATLIVPVQDTIAGAAGNVAAGAIAKVTATLTGIDAVTNVAAFTNGANQESDSALKVRFAAYILGLSRGDIFGLTASILGTAVNVQWTLTESYNLDGSWHPGYFFVVADDGSGAPSSAFLNIITNAANAVRPLGTQCSVFPPTVIWATISLQITAKPNYTLTVLEAQVSAAIAANINGLGLGNSLEWSIISAWAYAVPGVATVTAVLINGESGDSASLSATKTTQDSKQTIGYAAIKCAGVEIG